MILTVIYLFRLYYLSGRNLYFNGGMLTQKVFRSLVFIFPFFVLKQLIIKAL